MQRAFDRTDLGTDPRFDDRTKRIDNYLALADEFQKTAVTQPHDYWATRMAAEDVPFAPVNSLPEVYDDPQVKHLGTFASITHPDHGTYTAIRRPVTFDGVRDDQPLEPCSRAKCFSGSCLDKRYVDLFPIIYF